MRQVDDDSDACAGSREIYTCDPRLTGSRRRRRLLAGGAAVVTILGLGLVTHLVRERYGSVGRPALVQLAIKPVGEVWLDGELKGSSPPRSAEVPGESVSDQPTFTHFGRYRVTRELGRGAMGVVYEAEDESLQRKLAIKTMLLSDDGQERVQQEARFRQEAKAAAGLNHPNIVTIYELGREGDWLYIAMELVIGVELRGLMDQGRLPLRTAVELAAQIASGIAAAHARGIVHRDIKPSNIMVLPKNHVKIMDFGVARMQVSDVQTQTGLMLGSPKYMAPEQVEGQVVDHRSDIFSLGSVLYEMVTGVPPFQGSDIAPLLFDIVRAAPPPPTQRNPEIPTALEAVLAKAMHKDPAGRYQDASHFSDELLRCAGSLPAATASASASEAPRSGATGQSFEPTLQEARPATYPLSRHFDSSAAMQRISHRG